MIKKKYRENAIVILIAIVLIFGIVIFTGSMSSGYHLIDDHWAYRIASELQQSNIWEVMFRRVNEDLVWRFRPLYEIEQVLRTIAFGTDLNLWMFYTAVLGVITSFFLWKFARLLNMDYVYSAFFVSVCILGPQFVVWCRQANQENTGFLLLAITLCLLVKEVKNRCAGERNLGCQILLTLFVVATSLYKEAFVIMIPAYILLSMSIAVDPDIVGRSSNDEMLVASPKQMWKKAVPLYAVWLVVMAVELMIIVFCVGTGETDYAGFSVTTGLSEYVEGIVLSLTRSKNGCIGITCLIGAFLAYEIYLRRGLKKYSGYLVTGLYIVCSQLVLHAKSKMWTRYMIPCIVGVAILAVVIVAKQIQSDKREKENVSGTEWANRIYIGFLIVFILVGISSSAKQAEKWARTSADGDGGILQVLASATWVGDDILLFADETERTGSVKIWLEARERNVITYSDGMDCSSYPIMVVETPEIENEEKLLKQLNWKGFREAYDKDDFIIWVQESDE